MREGIFINNIALAFLMTILAGLSTGIGSFITLFTKKANPKFLSVSLGFSAGVMIYVSMVEIFAEAKSTLSATTGAKQGAILTVVGFFSGMLLIALIDKLIPKDKNPHELKKAENIKDIIPAKSRLKRLGIFTAIALAIHNFPEGLATFVSALREPTIAIPIVVAIAIHNIPEGIAVAYPIYYATGSRRKAFFYSLASGLCEPLGALFGYLVLMPIMNDIVFGIVFASVAGIMVFISLDELLPAAREYGEHHLAIYGLVAGMVVMAISLILFI